MTFTPSSGGGTENATLTFGGTNLAGSPVNIPLTGIGASTAAGFTFMPQSTPGGGSASVATLSPGQTAIFPLVIAPNTGFVGPITVACGTLTPPTNTTLCSVSMPTVNITTSPSPAVTVQLTFQTNCVVSGSPPGTPDSQPPGPVVPSPLGATALLALVMALGWRKSGQGGSRSAVRGLVSACALVLLVLLVMTCTACVKDPPPVIPNAPTTPAGSYTLPVTATAPGGVVRTITLTINVT